MVLHPSLSHRESTQDVDYLHRSFVSEYRALGFPDAGERLCVCIAQTARKFDLGADWMNDHADVALPWALEYAMTLTSPLSNSVRLNVLTICSSIPSCTPQLAAKRGAHATRSSLPRHIDKAQFRRRSSASGASRSSRCRGRGRSRSSSRATRSRTRWTVLRCYVSASCSAASTGRLLGSSSGSRSAARRWAIPTSNPRRSSSFGSAYRMRSIARFRLGRKVCQCRARRARHPCIARGGYPSNTPPCHVK